MREYVDFSGKRRWAAVQSTLMQEGESVDFRRTAPDPIPDEQNFCAIDPLKNLALIPENNDAKGDQSLKRLRLMNTALPQSGGAAEETAKLFQTVRSGGGVINVPDGGYILPPKLSRGAAYGTPTDITAWANWMRKYGMPPAPDTGNAARDVLAALSKDDELVSELAIGLSRPESQWTPAWKTRDLPENLFPLPNPNSQWDAAQVLTKMLCLRSIAAARAGDAAKAHQALLIAVRINQAFMTEPFMISALVASGNTALITGAVWELCDAQSGTADEYRMLQEALSRLDFQKCFLYAERGDLTFAARASAYIKRTRDLPFLFPSWMQGQDEKQSMQLGVHLIPDGWFDANTATITQWRLTYYIKPLRDSGFRELLAKKTELDALIAEREEQLSYEHFDEVLALIALSADSSVTYRMVYAQSLVSEAIAACALERYRIEHTAYPDTLEAANRTAERSIPMDVISGRPMRYHKTADGKYKLWCIGFDGKDDGGKRVNDAEAPGSPKFYDPKYLGDWVWDFPVKYNRLHP